MANAYFLFKVNYRMTDVTYIMYYVTAANVYTQTYLALRTPKIITIKHLRVGGSLTSTREYTRGTSMAGRVFG